jgi:hypothetical protein
MGLPWLSPGSYPGSPGASSGTSYITLRLKSQQISVHIVAPSLSKFLLDKLEALAVTQHITMHLVRKSGTTLMKILFYDCYYTQQNNIVRVYHVLAIFGSLEL